MCKSEYKTETYTSVHSTLEMILYVSSDYSHFFAETQKANKKDQLTYHSYIVCVSYTGDAGLFDHFIQE